MNGMYFMRDTFNNRVTCPMMICPTVQMQQISMNSPCRYHKYFSTSDAIYRSNPCEKMCLGAAMGKVYKRNIFQIEMRPVQLSEIKD